MKYLFFILLFLFTACAKPMDSTDCVDEVQSQIGTDTSVEVIHTLCNSENNDSDSVVKILKNTVESN